MSYVIFTDNDSRRHGVIATQTHKNKVDDQTKQEEWKQHKEDLAHVNIEH